jgi:hypothetical protein
MDSKVGEKAVMGRGLGEAAEIRPDRTARRREAGSWGGAGFEAGVGLESEGGSWRTAFVLT